MGTRKIKNKENPEEEINGGDGKLKMTLTGFPQNVLILYFRDLLLTTTGKSTL